MGYKTPVGVLSSLSRLDGIARADAREAIHEGRRELERFEKVDSDIRHFERQKVILETALLEAVAKGDDVVVLKIQQVLENNARNLKTVYEIKKDRELCLMAVQADKQKD